MLTSLPRRSSQRASVVPSIKSYVCLLWFIVTPCAICQSINRPYTSPDRTPFQDRTAQSINRPHSPPDRIPFQDPVTQSINRPYTSPDRIPFQDRTAQSINRPYSPPDCNPFQDRTAQSVIVPTVLLIVFHFRTAPHNQ